MCIYGVFVCGCGGCMCVYVCVFMCVCDLIRRSAWGVRVCIWVCVCGWVLVCVCILSGQLLLITGRDSPCVQALLFTLHRATHSMAPSTQTAHQLFCALHEEKKSEKSRGNNARGRKTKSLFSDRICLKQNSTVFVHLCGKWTDNSCLNLFYLMLLFKMDVSRIYTNFSKAQRKINIHMLMLWV